MDPSTSWWAAGERIEQPSHEQTTGHQRDENLQKESNLTRSLPPPQHGEEDADHRGVNRHESEVAHLAFPSPLTAFYLRSGQAMAEKKTEIVIYFKPTPHCLFRDKARDAKPNQIVINVQPDEGVRLRFEGKVPGSGLKMKEVVMDFDYVEQWQTEPPDGYATLLHDAIRGDQTLFKHRDEIQCAWDAVQPVLDYWAEHPQDDLPNYAAGTWGPPASDLMMQRDGRYWRNG